MVIIAYLDPHTYFICIKQSTIDEYISNNFSVFDDGKIRTAKTYGTRR